MLVYGKIAMSVESNADAKSRPWSEEVDADIKGSDDSTMSEENCSRREISLEFLDGVNEQKFLKLVKEDKLKTRFKRRHSQTPSIESRSNSPNSCNESDTKEKDKGIRGFYGRKTEKRPRQNSYTSSSSSSSFLESDPAILSRRQKQIDYGKNTVAYEKYIETVPRFKRTRDHPRTPNKYGKYSRRAFDGLIKIWRRQLHYYDPPNECNTSEVALQIDSDSE